MIITPIQYRRQAILHVDPHGGEPELPPFIPVVREVTHEPQYSSTAMCQNEFNAMEEGHSLTFHSDPPLEPATDSHSHPLSCPTSFKRNIPPPVVPRCQTGPNVKSPSARTSAYKLRSSIDLGLAPVSLDPGDRHSFGRRIQSSLSETATFLGPKKQLGAIRGDSRELRSLFSQFGRA